MSEQIWFQGRSTKTIIFVEEDLKTVLKALAILTKDDTDEYKRASTRIYFQLGMK
jgi:hypothetical protein